MKLNDQINFFFTFLLHINKGTGRRETERSWYIYECHCLLKIIANQIQPIYVVNKKERKTARILVMSILENVLLETEWLGFVWFMMSKDTFNKISVISWRYFNYEISH